jgi:indolepyruvate ferredoxin oxidoreductase
MSAPCPESPRSGIASVTLDDKYTLSRGPAFMSGVQALVKLPMLQRQRDLALGKNTAGFVSGYRGSPLGGYDQALAKAEQYLKAHHIVFQPGVNEELAATALWGTQQLGFAPPGSNKYDGVFGIWYGKGPGVDRCSDVFKHANMAGTTEWGGVIAVAGMTMWLKARRRRTRATISSRLAAYRCFSLPRCRKFWILGCMLLR